MCDEHFVTTILQGSFGWMNIVPIRTFLIHLTIFFIISWIAWRPQDTQRKSSFRVDSICETILTSGQFVGLSDYVSRYHY